MTNIKASKFFYIDSKQKSTIEAQEITTTGGFLEVEIKFDWKKTIQSGRNLQIKSTVNGSGTAQGTCDEIIYSKQLIDDRDNKELYFNLTDSPKVTFDRGFRIQRISPETITED